jgi:hypothetical protein
LLRRSNADRRTVLQSSWRIGDDPVTATNAVAQFDSRTEITIDRDVPKMDGAILSDGCDTEPLAIEDYGFGGHDESLLNTRNRQVDLNIQARA